MSTAELATSDRFEPSGRATRYDRAAMATDIYERLARHLDTLPAGYPRTDSGVELRIIQRLFTPDEAALALHLTVIAEDARVVARRARMAEHEAMRLLDDMDRKRVILSEVRGGVTRYMAVQFVVGFWEGQVDRLTPELVRDFEEYLPLLFDAETWRRAPQMRIVPAEASVGARAEVMPHELVAELVQGARGHFAVSNCICRQERELVGEGCDRPKASCLSFGGGADYVTRSGRGRAASREEVLEILQRADEAGLVLQASNAKRAVFLCTCCGCCCGVLRSIKRHPDPARIVATPFAVALDTDACSGCGACEPRCQVDALRLADGRAMLDARRCIGCGLCVTTCPSGALSIVRRPEADQPEVPRTLVSNYLKVARARGRLGLTELAGLELRSLADRWRARATGD
jgi:Na+-translocating ferredoxin:NAD+ oxidoreductase subunit B